MSSGGGGGRPSARVAVKMEVAPFYGEDGLELLPDFVQLPGFGAGAGAGLEPPEDSGADPRHKLLLAGKKLLQQPQPPRDLVGAASPGGVALPPAAAGPFPSLRPRAAAASSAVHRLIPEAPGGGGPEVGPGVLQPLLKLPAAADLEQLLIQAGSPGLGGGPASPTGGGGGGGGGPSCSARLRLPPAAAAAAAAARDPGAGGLRRRLREGAGRPAQAEPAAGGAAGAAALAHRAPGRPDSPAVYTTLGGFNPGSPPSASGGAFFSPPPPAVARLPAPGSTGRALEEPQTVPEAAGTVTAVPPAAAAAALSSGESPPPPSSSLSPLDAESQERLKAERKRLRNRIAASKCRRRKLERIARLEEKVKALKGQNAELAATASLLRAQVTQLQGRVRSHLSSGCHINAAAAAPAPAQTSGVSGQPPGREGPTEPETSAC
ncbi:hypothetical protein JRQ81_013248 [Phrynocephalus forsythii]|uniref:Transcription factor JunB n=1 Tax=Phrynocephalus forsythii TaxID=171643 RepID=A0A9Q0XZT2_9SAUR|nr:hypothetical protein JRQ81_013248 [Phrynocephalus forsythii]